MINYYFLNPVVALIYISLIISNWGSRLASGWRINAPQANRNLSADHSFHLKYDREAQRLLDFVRKGNHTRGSPWYGNMWLEWTIVYVGCYKPTLSLFMTIARVESRGVLGGGKSPLCTGVYQRWRPFHNRQGMKVILDRQWKWLNRIQHPTLCQVYVG